MRELIKTGESLLQKPASRMNLETGIFEPAHNNGATNQEALTRYSDVT